MGMKLEGKKLVITLTLKEPKPSRSGKTLLVGSTRGVKKSGVRILGKAVRFVANAFVDNGSRRSSRGQKAVAKSAAPEKQK